MRGYLQALIDTISPRLRSLGILRFLDANYVDSSWTDTPASEGIKLSSSATEWTAFKTFFGQVSLLRAFGLVASGVTGLEYATPTAFREAAAPPNGAAIRILSTNKTYRYTEAIGAGWADNDNTILKPNVVSVGSNGRALLDESSTTCATFADLRGLVDGKAEVVHLLAHTNFGDGGGGDFDRKPLGAYVDDGGTVAVAGSYAYVRRAAGSEPANPCWWGADGRWYAGSTPNSTLAWQRCLQWVAVDPHRRSMVAPPGIFLITDELLVGTNTRVVGNGNCLLYFNCPGKSCLVLGRGAHAYGVTLKGFQVDGPASCGVAAVLVDSALLGFDIDLVVRGGFTYGFRSHYQDASLQTGAVQWGDLKLSTLRALAGPVPLNYLWSDGWINACRVDVNAVSGGAGSTGITLVGGNTGGGDHYSIFTGDIETYEKGLSLQKVKNAHFVRFTTESNSVPNTIDQCVGCLFDTVGSTAPTLVTASLDNQFLSWVGTLDFDNACVGNRREVAGQGPPEEGGVVRETAAEISVGGTVYGNGRNLIAGFGVTEPQNILPNGDFARWPADILAPAGCNIWTGEATKCGDGCVDTTRTQFSRWSALLKNVGGDVTNRWGFAWPLLASLPDFLLNCDITVSFKAKAKVGLLSGMAASINYRSTYQGGYPLFGSMPAENGFTWFGTTTRIDANQLAHGLQIEISGSNGSEVYLSELSLLIGSTAPKTFSRCTLSANNDFNGEVGANGNLMFYVTSVPVGATDPLYGRAWVNGDYAALTNHVVETTAGGQPFVTTGWVRLGGAWVPVQQLTGLVGV